MKISKFTWIILCLNFILQSQNLTAQNQLKVHSRGHLQMISEQLSSRLQEQENEFLVTSQKPRSGLDNNYSINYIYENEKYAVVIDLFICSNQEVAIQGYQKSLIGLNGLTGKTLQDLGDDSYGIPQGTLFIRKDNLLICIYVNRSEKVDKKDKIDLAQSDGEISTSISTIESRDEQKPPLPVKLELAKKFARNILAFFEEQSK